MQSFTSYRFASMKFIVLVKQNSQGKVQKPKRIMHSVVTK